MQVTPLTNGAKTTASRKVKLREEKEEEKETEGKTQVKEEEEDCTVETVYETLLNIWTIRWYHFRLKLEFIIVIFITALHLFPYLIPKIEQEIAEKFCKNS